MALLCTSFLPYRADDVGGIKCSDKASIHRIPTLHFFFAACARAHPIVSPTLVSMTTVGYAEVYGKFIAISALEIRTAIEDAEIYGIQ